jgi:flagellar biosynthesis protein
MYNYKNFQKNQKAVALGYEKNQDYAPKVLASGKGMIAEKIIELAKENNIPLHRDADLVEILSVLEINEYIPLEVYSVIAEIFTYIYEEDAKKKQSEPPRDKPRGIKSASRVQAALAPCLLFPVAQYIF